MAREKAVLGEYEEATEAFGMVMKKIQFQIKKNINDQDGYTRWE